MAAVKKKPAKAEAAPGAVPTQSIPLGQLVEAAWNANRVPPKTLAKVRRSLTEFGVVENLVARPHPEREGLFEVLSGNHRLRLLNELGYAEAPVVVVHLDNARARLLAQTLNRTRGTDDPKIYAQLLADVLADLDITEVLGLLPETEATIDRAIRELGPDAAEAPLPELPTEPRSKPGEIYELGPHRLACGDATDPALVAELLGDAQVAILATDPPYGVELDHAWRDGTKLQRLGAARGGQIKNDDRADWTEALALCNAPVAYLWHSALYAHVARDSLLGCGYEIRAQIIWSKPVHAIGRGHYQWAHECCWYGVRKGCSGSWHGGRKQTTVWQAASPLSPFSSPQAEDAVTRHPTQKPLELFERPYLNHTERGDVVYEPFAGSGTALIAAEKTGRRCLAVELDPRWCDVIRDRYDAIARTSG